MTYDPTQQTPPPEPPPRKSNTTKIVLIVLFVLVILALICCGGVFALYRFSAGQLAGQLTQHPVVVEQFGEATIEPVILPPGNVAERLTERGVGHMVFEADGEKADGHIIVKQGGPGQPEPVEIILSDGTVIPIEE